MASYDREGALVRHLLKRLGMGDAGIANPNADGGQTGIDVAVRLADGRTIGIQVTEIDPYPKPGLARAQEKAIAKSAPGKPYGMWGQNDPSVVLSALARVTTRKVDIADKHSFDRYDEVWLLICAGISEYGAVVSTLVMTPWLPAKDLDTATDSFLNTSKYSRCFILPILATERAFYRWEKDTRWEKRVQLDDIHDVPGEPYVDDLMKEAKGENWQEVDTLCDKECLKVLAEMRQN